MSRARLDHGVPHEHRRAAGGRRRIVRHDRRVAHHDHDAVRARRRAPCRRSARAPSARPGPCRTCPTGPTRSRRSAARTIASDADAVDELFRPSEMPRPRFGGSGACQSIARSADVERRRPVAVGRRVVRNERLALSRQVAAANLDRIDPQQPGGLGQLRSRPPTTPAACRTLETPCSASCATAARAPSTCAFGVRYGPHAA